MNKLTCVILALVVVCVASLVAANGFGGPGGFEQGGYGGHRHGGHGYGHGHGLRHRGGRCLRGRYGCRGGRVGIHGGGFRGHEGSFGGFNGYNRGGSLNEFDQDQAGFVGNHNQFAAGGQENDFNDDSSFHKNQGFSKDVTTKREKVSGVNQVDANRDVNGHSASGFVDGESDNFAGGRSNTHGLNAQGFESGASGFGGQEADVSAGGFGAQI